MIKSQRLHARYATVAVNVPPALRRWGFFVPLVCLLLKPNIQKEVWFFPKTPLAQNRC